VAWTPTSAATLRFVAVVVAIAAVLAVALAIDAAFRVTVSHLSRFQRLGFASSSME
jgi:hypothetical protein